MLIHCDYDLKERYGIVPSSRALEVEMYYGDESLVLLTHWTSLHWKTRIRSQSAKLLPAPSSLIFNTGSWRIGRSGSQYHNLGSHRYLPLFLLHCNHHKARKDHHPPRRYGTRCIDHRGEG